MHSLVSLAGDVLDCVPGAVWFLVGTIVGIVFATSFIAWTLA